MPRSTIAKASVRKLEDPPTNVTIAEAIDLPLEELHLDLDNPRFGGIKKRKLSELELVNVIADEHDLTDLLSSISANGYFHSEPLIGVRNKHKGGGITIMEGNRRLSACLILAGDERAADQKNRRVTHLPSRFQAGDKLPVFVYDWENLDDRRQLLPYLGIRHIVGSLEWDSYAKAAWVDSVLKQEILTLDEIVRMVGDKNRTIVRLLDGYYFVNQVEETKSYVAQSSNRRGRGSKSEYPFSWVYNALDYDSIRGFVGLKSREKVPKSNPIDKSRLENAGELMAWMFGDKTRQAAIADSRDLKDLAKALSHGASLRELRKGERLATALDIARPKRERILEKLEDAADLAEEAFGLLLGVTREEAAEMLPASSRLSQAAREVRGKLLKLQDDEGSEVDAQ